MRSTTAPPMAPPRMQAIAKLETVSARVRLQHPDDEDRRAHADAGEQPALPARVVGQEREGRPGVVGSHDAEEARDAGRVAEPVVAEDQRLGELVQENRTSARPSQGQMPAPDDDSVAGVVVAVRAIRRRSALRPRRRGCWAASRIVGWAGGVADIGCGSASSARTWCRCVGVITVAQAASPASQIDPAEVM